MCLMVIGFGMRHARCINQEIAVFWMRGLGMMRMDGLICSTPSGVGSPKIRFNAKVMLEKLRNQRLVFVGDSIGRNQWESLLCMLSSAVPNKDSIYEVNGSPITKHKRFLVFKFRDYNCTVEYYQAPFLVLQSRPPAKSPPQIKTILKLGQMDWSSSKWRDADVLVFNTGHWWNYEKTIRGGCYLQGAKVKMETKVDSAYRKFLDTVIDWIHCEVNTSKTRVFSCTYSPPFISGTLLSKKSVRVEKQWGHPIYIMAKTTGSSHADWVNYIASLASIASFGTYLGSYLAEKPPLLGSEGVEAVVALGTAIQAQGESLQEEMTTIGSDIETIKKDIQELKKKKFGFRFW